MDRCAQSIGSSQFKAAGNWNRQTLAIRFRPAAICHQRQNSDRGKIARFFFRSLYLIGPRANNTDDSTSLPLKRNRRMRSFFRSLHAP